MSNNNNGNGGQLTRAFMAHVKLEDLSGALDRIDWLNLKGAALTPHSSRRIRMTLAHSLYEDNEDTVAATEIARTILAQGRQSTRSTTSEAKDATWPAITSSVIVVTML